jgi:hypothetical protein
MKLWTELGLPLLLAFAAGAIAVFWPWLQSWQRGRKFEGIIRRELQEVGPYPEEPEAKRPWWNHLSKRFAHEEVFVRERLSENREFLLSLHPDVVYAVNQLWIAYDKRDGSQWLHYLHEAATIARITSDELQAALPKWEAIVEMQPEAWRDPGLVRGAVPEGAAVERVPGLFERRLESYMALVECTRDTRDRKQAVERMTDWYFERGGGLLMSGRALNQFRAVRRTLASGGNAGDQLSLLRTDLKIDLGVRHHDERLIESALPEDERRF